MIDSYAVAAAVFLVTCSAQADEKDCLAGRSRSVNRAVERDRQSRLEIEAIESVDDVEVLAVGRPRVTVRLGKVDPQPRVLTWVGHTKAVARERAARMTRQVEEGVNRLLIALFTGSDSASDK